MEVANFILQFGIFIVLIVLGAAIYYLVSLICGYNIFIGTNHVRPVIFSFLFGLIAVFFSDIPKDLLDVCCKHGSMVTPQVLRECLFYLQDFTHYNKLFFLSIALAFLVSGIIGSDFLMNLWKSKALRKELRVRIPLSQWDIALWLYGRTGRKARIYTKDNNGFIRGELDFRSIGDEPEEIILKNPKTKNNTSLGNFMLIRGDVIEKLVLEEEPKKHEEYKIWQALNDIFIGNLLHIITFVIGLLFLIAYILKPIWPFTVWPLNLIIISFIVILNILL